ncbi:MAG: PhoB family transcriptional regulator [Cohnella sp.]|nr:PhoB family transcriptional regulator [Cohnella sp.]
MKRKIYQGGLTMNVLVVEDETKIQRLLQMELSHEGYRVEVANDGRSGLNKARQKPWDLIILDIMLPELNGMEVLRSIRESDVYTPIIMLTAKKSTPDKVTGLDYGANDYVVKPFVIEELLARMRSCIRHSKEKPDSSLADDSSLSSGGLRLNKLTREVYREGKQIDLTPKEFDLLVYFMENKGLVLDREQIINFVWGFDFFGDANIVDVYVRYLRKKMDYDFPEQLIETIRGVGYRFRKASP